MRAVLICCLSPVCPSWTSRGWVDRRVVAGRGHVRSLPVEQVSSSLSSAGKHSRQEIVAQHILVVDGCG